MKPFSLSKLQQQQVIDKTDCFIQLANHKMHLNLPHVLIKFDLKGRASGMFVVRQKELCIRYNEIIFSKYFDDNLLNTVAHEVAHYVVYSKWGVKKVNPHGKEWKQVMNLFNVEAQVTSNYDVSDLPLHRQAQHEYICGCMSHQLSSTRHNKVQKKKVIYKCRKCFQSLRWKLARC